MVKGVPQPINKLSARRHPAPNKVFLDFVSIIAFDGYFRKDVISYDVIILIHGFWVARINRLVKLRIILMSRYIIKVSLRGGAIVVHRGFFIYNARMRFGSFCHMS